MGRRSTGTAADFEPFWAVTKHADIRYISSHPELFSNTQILRINDTESIGIGERGREINANRYGGHPSDPPDFIFMDPPEHRQHRKLVAHHFTPRMMKKLEDHFGEMAENYVSDFADSIVADFTDRGSRSAVDVVHELTAKLPVAAICDMGGVPEEDWDKIFHWTEAGIGAADPEFRLPGEDREQTIRRVNLEFNLYNENLVRDRQANGLGDDLLSDLLRADIDGQKLTPREISSYFRLLLGAGNETTRNSITGGIKALIDHRDQLEDLVANPELVPSAVEEILRWTSIVIQFQRTATQDLELRGQQIRKGDSVVIWYPSANRDEEVFPDPYKATSAATRTTISPLAATASTSASARTWPVGRCARSSIRCCRSCPILSWPASPRWFPVRFMLVGSSDRWCATARSRRRRSGIQ